MKKIYTNHFVKFICLSLFAVLLFSACGKGCGKKIASKADAAAFQLIPVESNVVMGMDWKKLEKSPLGQKMKEGIPSNVAPFLEGVEGVILGFNIKGVGKEPEDFVAVVSGKLDQAKLLAEVAKKLQSEGAGALTDEEYSGVKIHSSPKDPTIGIAFLGAQGVFGKKNGVKKAIDLSQKKGESIETNKALMEMIGNLDTGKMLWAVGLVPAGAIPAAGAGGPMGALSGIKALDLAIDYQDNLTVDLGIITGAEEDAKQMQTMANSYKTLFGTSLAQKDPSLGKLLGGLNIEAKGKKVLLSLKLDQATVDELSKKAENAIPTDKVVEVEEEAEMQMIVEEQPGAAAQ